MPDEVLEDQPFIVVGKEESVKEVLDMDGRARGVVFRIVTMRRWTLVDPLDVHEEESIGAPASESTPENTEKATDSITT